MSRLINLSAPPPELILEYSYLKVKVIEDGFNSVVKSHPYELQYIYNSYSPIPIFLYFFNCFFFIYFIEERGVVVQIHHFWLASC